MTFPEHKCGLYLTHNEHKDYYQTAEQAIKELEERDNMSIDWATPTSRQRCIDTNEIWSLQWYPNTPVGFNIIHGATLEEVIEAANN